MDFAWWPHKARETVASFRLRCAQIITELSREGLSCGLYAPESDAAPKVLVLSKRYDRDSVAHAVALRARTQTKIVLDLCDNHFFLADSDPKWQARADALKHAVDAADLVIAATDALAKAIIDARPDARVTVIGDAAEPPFTPDVFGKLTALVPELELAAFKLALAPPVERRRLVWFGNSVSTPTEGGMLDLERIYPSLEALDAAIPISLSIISNSHKKYAELTRSWRITTHYLRWRRTTFSRALRAHAVAVIPIGVNAYTRCKTNNRLITALVHDLGVVADTIPAYEAFAEAAVLDDWQVGLRRLLTDSAERQRRIEIGKRLQSTEWTLAVIAGLWRKTLTTLVA